MSAGRKAWGAVVWLWMCVVSICRRLTGRSNKCPSSSKRAVNSASGNVGTSPATGQEMAEWEESWNTMEPFTVTVVPTDQSDQDLFQDMQPVLKKTKKQQVFVGDKESHDDKPDKCKFAVEAEFGGVGSAELGVWEEEESGGWEGEMGREEGSLVVASREVMAQKRKEEREKRKKLQEALRFSQRRQPGSLGTRLSDSSS